MIVLGTRPETIKLAPVVRALLERDVEPIVVATGQHREMLDQALHDVAVVPDHDLEVMAPRQTLASLTVRLLAAIEPLLASTRPDVVVVQGDTTTAFAAGLAAFYAQVPVAHVEAGLRTNRIDNPFPEELNRRMVGQLATWHFAPTSRAAQNLRREGVDEKTIRVTGNTVIDNLLWTLDRSGGQSAFGSRWGCRVLVTLHRRESQGRVMEGVAWAIGRVADRGDVEVVLPLHQNPAVRAAILPRLEAHPAVRLVEPLGYLDFTRTLADADLVLTDSGGVQEEAPSLGKPVLVLRETTERPEGVEAGTALLVGTSPSDIVERTTELLDDDALRRRIGRRVNPYGDGHAARRIVEALACDLGVDASTRRVRRATPEKSRLT